MNAPEISVNPLGKYLDPILAFLDCETPDGWLERASQADQRHVLLVDHANCEKKAASTALHLMHRYVEHDQLLSKMSRLAREELRHFEQVLKLLQSRGLAYPQLSAARYAAQLRELVSKNEPLRLVDTLLVGAIIEARSCERFAALAPRLDRELGDFYLSLLRSESRHFMDYLGLAKKLAPDVDVDSRLQPLLNRERQLIEGADPEFRFHSGNPAL